ncbi:MAG: putative DNA binding domain-containing protein [Chitinispirillales bacterium]|jgi:hypothetical protein|nr:putative DNA binding domain-containing protein [Chitinispirillales bacterium]
MQEGKQVVTSFLKQILKKELRQGVLFLSFTNPQILDISYPTLTILKDASEFTALKQKEFDVVIGDLPFGMLSVELDTASKVKGKKNWNFIITSLRMLKESGQAFFLVEPSLLFSQAGKQLLNDLFEEGFFYNSVFELPKKLLYPETGFQPIIIHFEKKKQENLFIAEITDEFENLLNNFYTKTATKYIETGVFVDREGFESFNKYKIEREIESLKTQYSDYKKYVLEDIAIEINTTRHNTTFHDKPNSVYISSIGNSAVVSDINEATVKHQNLFQVVLNPDLVKAEFLVMFFSSELGRKQLQRITTGNFIQRIGKNDFSNYIVSVPPLKEQDVLIHTEVELSKLQSEINQLRSELSLNPKNAGTILDIIEKIQGQLKQMTDEDYILSLVRKGENKYVEFKETFDKDVKKGTKEKNIKHESIKTIFAFLNTGGGTLLIGVTDDNEIKGVENDFFKNADKYKENFANAIRDNIGLEFLPFIDYKLVMVKGKNILMVNCKAAERPCFYDQEGLFVRMNARTEELKGQKLLDYVKAHFK